MPRSSRPVARSVIGGLLEHGLEQVALTRAEAALAGEALEQLLARAAEDAVDHLAQQPPRDLLVRLSRTIAERSLVVGLGEEAFVGEDADQRRHGRVGTV